MRDKSVNNFETLFLFIKKEEEHKNQEHCYFCNICHFFECNKLFNNEINHTQNSHRLLPFCNLLVQVCILCHLFSLNKRVSVDIRFFRNFAISFKL